MVAVIIATVFVGCSAESYKNQLEKKGYTVTVADNAASLKIVTGSLKLAGLDLKGDIEYIVSGVKDDSMVCYIKFEKSKDASSFRKEAKSGDVKVGGTGATVKLTINK